MSYTLTHPDKGTATVKSEALRDRYLRRGFTLQVPLGELSYPELQALARQKGIPANQSRAKLEKALR